MQTKEAAGWAEFQEVASLPADKNFSDHLLHATDTGKAWIAGIAALHAIIISAIFGSQWLVSTNHSWAATYVFYANFTTGSLVTTTATNPYRTSIDVQVALFVPIVLVAAMYAFQILRVCLANSTPAQIVEENTPEGTNELITKKINKQDDLNKVQRKKTREGGVYPGVDNFLLYANLLVFPLYTGIVQNMLGEKSFSANLDLAVLVFGYFSSIFLFESMVGTTLNLKIAKRRQAEVAPNPPAIGPINKLRDEIVNLTEIIYISGFVFITLTTITILSNLTWPYAEIASNGAALSTGQGLALWSLVVYFILRYVWFLFFTMSTLMPFALPVPGWLGGMSEYNCKYDSQFSKYFVAFMPHLLFGFVMDAVAGGLLAAYNNQGLGHL